jgi:hypothetical protein
MSFWFGASLPCRILFGASVYKGFGSVLLLCEVFGLVPFICGGWVLRGPCDEDNLFSPCRGEISAWSVWRIWLGAPDVWRIWLVASFVCRI